MQCTWCTQEFKPGEKIVYGGADKYHESCLKAKREDAQKKRQEAMSKAAGIAIHKWCPFPADQNCRCVANSCMAWDGYDCRRLQIGEVN